MDTSLRTSLRASSRSASRSAVHTDLESTAMPPRVIVYALENFSAADAAVFKAIAEDPRGWASQGFVFRSFDDGTSRQTSRTSGRTRRTSGGSRATRSPRRSHLKDVAPDCVVRLTPPAELARLYPQVALHGLSVTDRRASPIAVHVHAGNWTAVPTESEYAASDLGAYRTHLVHHELGHVLGYNHTPCPSPGGPCHTMQQPSRPLGGCAPYPFVDGCGGSATESAPVYTPSIAAAARA